MKDVESGKVVQIFKFVDNSYYYQHKLHNLGGNERHAVKLKTGFLVSTSEDMPNS